MYNPNGNMNICIISPHYPYMDNMSYVFVKKLVDEWARMGHRCVVLTPFSLTSYFRRINPFVPVHYTDDTVTDNPVEVYNPRYVSLPRLHLWGFEVNSCVVSRVLYGTLKEMGFIPNLIYCHFFRSAVAGWYISKKLDVPVFVASGESAIGEIFSPSWNFSLELFRHDVRGCICVSTKNKDEAISAGLVDEEKCAVFPNGTDLSVFQKKDRAECRQKLGLNQRDFIVACVGGFVERKGQKRIVEAIRKIGNPNVKLMFIGSGNMPLEHESIVFKARVNNTALPDYLNAADVFCLPTLAEGCCNAIIEAMACGLPVISSDLPFNHDVLDADNSILVDPLDISAISRAILKLYEHPELRMRFSRVSLERSRSLSIEQRSKDILSFIEYRM